MEQAIAKGLVDGTVHHTTSTNLKANANNKNHYDTAVVANHGRITGTRWMIARKVNCSPMPLTIGPLPSLRSGVGWLGGQETFSFASLPLINGSNSLDFT